MILNAGKDLLREHTAFVVTLLESMGFQVNSKLSKSHLLPVKRLEFLGFIVDSVTRELICLRRK